MGCNDEWIDRDELIGIKADVKHSVTVAEPFA